MILPIKRIPFAENYQSKYKLPLLKIIILINIKAIKAKIFSQRKNQLSNRDAPYYYLFSFPFDFVNSKRSRCFLIVY
jgi:hypothetical protein